MYCECHNGGRKCKKIPRLSCAPRRSHTVLPSTTMIVDAHIVLPQSASKLSVHSRAIHPPLLFGWSKFLPIGVHMVDKSAHIGLVMSTWDFSATTLRIALSKSQGFPSVVGDDDEDDPFCLL